ncbi:MAG: PepSY domain-containing protein [Bacteroidales bacterium]|nr:PepSY domain-containing protein [Bacteroidales bacterium]
MKRKTKIILIMAPTLILAIFTLFMLSSHNMHASIPTQQQTAIEQTVLIDFSNRPPARIPGSFFRRPYVTLEQAIAIAYAELERRGISAAFITHSGIGVERFRRGWELEFMSNTTRHTLEFYIDINNGQIISMEAD